MTDYKKGAPLDYRGEKVTAKYGGTDNSGRFVVVSFPNGGTLAVPKGEVKAWQEK